MSVERALIADIGDAGARLHTGRSRNDQVATDTRLFAKQRCEDLMAANVALRQALVRQAEAHFDVVLPGYTHMQHAQPVLFSHHMLAYVWMLARDFERLAAARTAADASPLGSAALAGTTYPLDRQMTAAELGFSRVIPNSLDAVSDRDFLLDLSYACSVSCIHLSRLCEEIVLWSSSEFGFIELSDAFSTGSSIMPQKKNPDFAGTHPRQDGPRGRRPRGAAGHPESAAAGLQQGHAGGQGGHLRRHRHGEASAWRCSRPWCVP